MLELFRNWTLQLAIAALCGGLVWLLAPKGSVQKALRTATAIFFLSAFLQPFLHSSDWAAAWEDGARGGTRETAPALENTLNAQRAAAAKDGITRELAAVLDTLEIKDAKIVAETDILEDGSINIKTVDVLIAADQMHLQAKIHEAARTRLGFEIKVSEKEEKT
jgi:hypothetical protein